MAPLPAFELDWNLVRTFVAVADGGSLTAAARQLGLAHPTVARHISQLEAQLGLVLFARGNQGLALNDCGQRLATQAAAMQREALVFERLSDSVREQPLLRVRVTASELLMELLPGLLAGGLAPGAPLATPVEFIVADEQLNLLERRADIAVRHVRPEQQELVCRRVGAVPMVACATPEYLARCGALELGNAPGHWFIDGASQPRFQQGAAAVGLHFADEQIAFRSDSLLAQRAAVSSGWGIAALPEPMLATLSNVQRLDTDTAQVAVEVWLVARPEVRNTRQLKTVYDQLGDELASCLST